MVTCAIFMGFIVVNMAMAEFDYCSISKKHTMCQYQGFGAKCTQVLGSGTDQREIKEILRVHNELRAKLANGLEKRGQPGPQPPAADMEEMEWDEELARVAQRHADQCVFAHDCSQCRKVPRFVVGQNLYIYKQSRKSADTNWKRAITDWYDEVKLFGKERVKPFRFSKDIGHYSAMVWSNTNKVGCGITEFRDGKWFAKLYTCNYGPAGNYIGGQMYEQGRACSKCPSGTSCSVQYPGLCVKEGLSNVISNDLGPRPSPFVRTTTKTTVKTTRRTTPATTRIPNRNKNTSKRPTLQDIFGNGSNKNKNSNRFLPPVKNLTTAKTTPKPTRRPTQRPTQRPTKRPTKNTTKRPTKRPIFTTTELSVIKPFRRPDVSNSFQCDFETRSKECEVKFSGKKWQFFTSATDNFYEIILNGGQRSEIFFSKMVPPPSGGVACLTFRYRKFLDDGGNTALQVVAWPFRGRPGKVNVMRSSPNPATWIRAQVTFRKVDNSWIILFRAAAPIKDKLYLAIDDVNVTEGSC